MARHRIRSVPPRVSALPTPPDPAPSRAVRKFLAARPDRLAGGFGLAAVSPRRDLQQDLRGVVAHARHAAQNVDHMVAFEKLVRRHVIGPRGIVLQSLAETADGSRDLAARRAIESAWREWGRRGNPTLCGRLSWWNVENVGVTMVAREGNFLLRGRIGRGLNKWGFRVEVLALDLLDVERREVLRDGSFIDGGIEFSETGFPRAFHFHSADPSDPFMRRALRRIRVPASEIIHVWRPTEAMQALGVPSAHAALRRFNMAHKYEESALAAAHFGASAMAFIKSAEGDAPGDGADVEADVPAEIEGGMLGRLGVGESLEHWSPPYPDGEMPAFMHHMMNGASVSLGVAASSLTGDMTKANYSSLVAGLDQERDEWRMFQRDIYEALHGPVFALWLRAALLNGAIALPAAEIDRLSPASWRPRGWRAVNPKDAADAAEADLANGVRSLSEIVAERGEDLEDVAERTAEDLALLKAKGLPLPRAWRETAGPGRPPAPDPDPDPETEA